MLSKDNLATLKTAQYKFIIAARIKSESKQVKKEILKKSAGMKNHDHFVLKRNDGIRLVITYSDKRARKDAQNREKGLKRLKKRIKNGRLTKQNINNRGYNKFLLLDGKVKIKIDEKKIEEDKRWDGLKGYLTNTRLSAKKVTENYSHLWQIEKAFRISKTDLRVRPMYHYRKRRIKAHLCIAFVAYALFKELEILLKKKKIDMSAQRAGELTHNMYELSYNLPDSYEQKRIILNMDEEQQDLYRCIHGN